MDRHYLSALNHQQIARQQPFLIDKSPNDASIVNDRLRIMKTFLRQDICGLRPLGLEGSIIDSQKVNEKIPPEVQDACLNWLFYFTRAQNDISDYEEIFCFLNEFFLYWIEALSLLRQLPKGIKIIKILQTLLQDCLQILEPNLLIISTAPLQIYSSVLLFAPYTNIIKQRFKSTIPKWVLLKPEAENSWNQSIHTIEGYRCWEVRSVAISQNLSLVASVSCDLTVRLWRADTGECVKTLQGHDGFVECVAFSHDSSLVASASRDQTVRLWDASTGECVRTLQGNSAWVSFVAFSHDSSLVASVSDETVRLWRVNTGECVKMLQGHSDWIWSVAFSHDSSLVASASSDLTVRLWDTDTGKCMQMLEGHERWIWSVAFSHDSSLVASASGDSTVRLWRANTGECVQTLDIGYIYHLSFEPTHSQLVTDIGAFTITETNCITHATGYGLSRDGRWITWNGNNLLWLPEKYRGSRRRFSKSTVVIGCYSGRVLVLAFSDYDS